MNGAFGTTPMTSHGAAALIPITVIVPVRNEERNLAESLPRLQDFSQVIVVDSSSTDGTGEVARRFNAEVVSFAWNGKFPKKRNWCLGHCSIRNDWVLFLDADEMVTDAFKAELVRVLPGSTHSGYWVRYDNYFMGHRLRFGDPFRKLSLFRVGAGEYERVEEDQWSSLDMEVHEHPVLTGTVGSLKSRVLHQDYRGMESYIAKHNAYSSWEARRYFAFAGSAGARAGLTRRQRIKYGLMNSWALGPLYFAGAYFLRGGFLDGRAGLLFAFLKMVYFLQVKCKIDEMNRASGGAVLLQPGDAAQGAEAAGLPPAGASAADVPGAVCRAVGLPGWPPGIDLLYIAHDLRVHDRPEGKRTAAEGKGVADLKKAPPMRNSEGT